MTDYASGMDDFMRENCIWTQDEDGVWDTSCDNAFTLIEGTPANNSMHYCCYCGHPLEQVLYTLSSDEIGDGMTDAEADADTLKSAGMGTDEDYAPGGNHEEFGD